MPPERNHSAHDIHWDIIDKKRYYLLNTSFFTLVRATVYPAILVKTRLQSQQNRFYLGTWDAFRKIWSREGVKGYYKGFTSFLVTTLPAQLLYVTSYELVRQYARQSPLMEYIPPHLRNLASEFIGGGLASLSSSLIAVPLDVVCQRLMVQDGVTHPQVYQGGVAALRMILATEGIRGLYRGYGASLLVYIPSSAIWWATYSTCKNWLMRVTTTAQNTSGSETPTSRESPQSSAVYSPPLGIDMNQVALYAVQTASAAAAGLTSAVLTNPLDVVKTRVQVATKAAHPTGSLTVQAILSELWRTEGFRGLARGATARAWSMVPISTIMLLAYEQVKRASAISAER